MLAISREFGPETGSSTACVVMCELKDLDELAEVLRAAFQFRCNRMPGERVVGTGMLFANTSGKAEHSK